MSATMTPLAAVRAVTYATTGDPFLFKRVKTWWVLLALLVIADGGGLFRTQEEHYKVKALKQLLESHDLLWLTVALFVICAALIFTQLVPTLRMMLRQKAVLAFAVLAFLSTLWSQVPFLTFRKAMLLFVFMAFAWFVAMYYSPADQMRLLLALGLIMALASIAWVILFPQYGTAPGGEWKGVFGRKNFLGSTMFFLFSGLPFCRISKRRELLTLAVQAILPIGLIILSGAVTPVFMMVVLIAVRVLGPLLTRMKKESAPFMLYCLSLGAAMIPVSLGIFLPLLGRDFTLTGRTLEWPIMFHFALERFWLGYGYQGFWTGTTGASGRVVDLLHAGVNTADNGYLELMLELGFVGLGLLVVLLIDCMRNFQRLLRRSSVPLVAYWYAGLILTIFVGGITEDMFWMPIRIVPFMLVLACAGLRRLSETSSRLAA